MFPFLVNAPTIEYPLSGDITQDISPSFIAAMKGVPEIERKIVTDVASYGDQLGTLTDAVLELAELAKFDGAKIRKLSHLSDEIEATKKDVRTALRERAEDALARLQKIDPEEHASLLATLKD